MALNKKRNISNSRAAIWFIEHSHTLVVFKPYMIEKKETKKMNKIEKFSFHFLDFEKQVAILNLPHLYVRSATILLDTTVYHCVHGVLPHRCTTK